jgi:hypothetical protein
MAPLSIGPETPYKIDPNSSVFNPFLKARAPSTNRSSVGRLFHAGGPATQNARSPNFNRVLLVTNVKLEAERRHHVPEIDRAPVVDNIVHQQTQLETDSLTNGEPVE